MYFITALQSNPRPGQPYKRCFGFHLDLFTAIDSVSDNVGNMHECIYDYIVIEHFSPGIHPIADNDVWFRWSEDAPVGWAKMDHKPSEFEGIINFAIG